MMTSVLGAAELPLTIILWVLAGLLTTGVLFGLVVALLAAVAEYYDQKQKLKSNELIRKSFK
jgi:flagellar biosynthesis protein FliQ